MAAECLSAIQLCRVRVTRLDALGNPTAGPNNVYVTDKPMMLTITPDVEAGTDKTLIGGCDCILGEYRGYDKIKRFNLEFDFGLLEWGLLEMLVGGSAIMASGFPIGMWFPTNQFSCSTPAQPNVAFEAWQTGWNVDQPDATFPYIRWIFPSSYWTLAPFTLQNDFMNPKLTGFTRKNSLWSMGPFHDQPEAAQPLGGGFYDTTIPAAACGYQSHSIT